MTKLVYFMRKEDRVGEKYLYLNSTPNIGYRHKYFFFFLVSDEAKDWITEQAKTHYCYLLYEKLRITLDLNEANYNGFLDDDESEQLLDISMHPLELVISHIDHSELKPTEEEV